MTACALLVAFFAVQMLFSSAIMHLLSQGFCILFQNRQKMGQ